MNLAVMDPAQRNGEFVAHLSADGARLGEADVMRLARLASADRARLLGDKSKMLFVPKAPELAVAAVDLLSR